MATTTPNYGWPVPTSTDYVKDGATAIEALGDAIDATVFGLPTGGALKLVKTQAIGSAVSSVIITSAFSATYNNYLIMVDNTTGSVSTDSVTLQMRTGSTTATTNYYGILDYRNYAGTAGFTNVNNGSGWTNFGRALGTSEKFSFGFHVFAPFLANKTTCATIMTTSTDLTGQATGLHNSATSYDQIVLSTTSGNLTGGTIYVYGYGLS